jgi:DNA uptake protein ComE-like DNA-binding protein
MRWRRAKTRSRRRGIALLMVLWVVVVCGMMMLGVMKACRAQRALAHEEFGAVEAHWLARAGVEQAMAVLEDDDPSADSPADKWYDNPGVFEKVTMGSGTFSVRSAADDDRAGLDDEAARVNLNVADKKQLTELKTLSETQVDSLIDWRKGGDQPSPSGAKAGYYQHLSFPYEMRGKDFQTHRELLLVQGFEDRSFFGRPGAALAAGGDAAQTTVYSYQPNRDPTGGPRINFNTVSADVLQQRFNFTPQLAAGVVQTRAGQQYQSLSDLLKVQPRQNAPAAPPANGPPSNEPPVAQLTIQWLAAHAEYITLNENPRQPGKINVNTASSEVLMTLPGINREIGDRIVNERSSSSGVFKTLADLLERHVLDEQVFRNVFEKLTVRSDVFTVESIGTSGAGVQRRILAVIDRGNDPMSILYWYQTP